MLPIAQIVGGIILRIPAIRSPNYVAGSSGWTINIDGSAEFNNLTVRGTFFGTDYIINASGIFLYTSTPALGNLAISIAPAAGSDTFGNAYGEGITIFNSSGTKIGSWGVNSLQTFTQSGGGFAEFITSGGAGSPAFEMGSGTAPASTKPATIATVNGTLTAGMDDIDFVSPISPIATDANQSWVYMILAQGTTATPAIGQLGFSNVGVPGNDFAALRWTQGSVAAAGIASFQPGGTTPEVWHTAALQTGFVALGGGFATPRYRLEPVGAGQMVRLSGGVQLNATEGVAALIFTLPVGYRPLASKFYTQSNTLSGSSLSNASLRVASDGTVRLGFSGVSGNNVMLDGVCFEVD